MAVVTVLTSACLNVPVQQSVWITGIHAKDGNEQLIESEKVGEREGMGVTGRGGANKKAGKERILIRALFLLFSSLSSISHALTSDIGVLPTSHIQSHGVQP